MYDKIISKLIAARKEIQPIGKDASGRFKYASLPAIIATVQPVLLKHGLFLTQNEVVVDNDISVLETTIFESEGQFIRATARINNPLFKDDKMNGIQNHGSILTYLKRYAIANMMCLEIQEDDPDDKPAPRTNQWNSDEISDSQINYINKLIGNNPQMGGKFAQQIDECGSYTKNQASEFIKQLEDYLGIKRNK
jgi:ERF superfamily